MGGTLNKDLLFVSLNNNKISYRNKKNLILSNIPYIKLYL
jgi:hypothetical protein